MFTKCNNARRFVAAFSLPAVAALSLAWVSTAQADDLKALIEGGKPVLDVRYRMEQVEQSGRPKDAAAQTVRVRAGYETGRVMGIGGAFDVEWIEHLGGQRFNDSINGKTNYPVVADPDDLAVNQLFLVADGVIPKSSFKLGRQRVIWDNARFIGNVGFRQNEQTYDAARLSTKALPASQRYSGLKPVTVTPFALFLDYDRAAQAANSSASYGVLVNAKQKLNDDVTAFFAGAYAYQEDHGNNAADYNLSYYNVEPGLGYGSWRLSAGVEQLDGNGAQSFRTPLATLHKFNGVTDQFLTTPTGGIRDLYGKAKTALPTIGGVGGIKLFGAYHEFSDDDGSTDYGREWNLGVAKSFTSDMGTVTDMGKVTFALQYADYDADTFGVDISKLWLTVSFKLKP